MGRGARFGGGKGVGKGGGGLIKRGLMGEWVNGRGLMGMGC